MGKKEQCPTKVHIHECKLHCRTLNGGWRGWMGQEEGDKRKEVVRGTSVDIVLCLDELCN